METTWLSGENFDSELIPGAVLRFLISSQLKSADGKLEKMTIKELNKYIQGIPKQQAQKIKKRRRILKNRKYALKCRLKTVQKRTKMAEENKSLEKRISAAKEELKTVTKQRDYRATNQNIYSFMRLLNQNSLK